MWTALIISLLGAANAGAQQAAAPPPPNPSPQPSPTANRQAVALLAFKNALTSSAVLASWANATDNPCGPPMWWGVVCDASGTVQQ